MIIGIIGSEGIVGGAHKFGFMQLGHQVRCHDLKLKTKLENLLNTEIIFVCVPTPFRKDGSCNADIVRKVIYDLNKLAYCGVVVIKSTIPPGTTENLTKETNLRLVHSAEFIRERMANADFVENHNLLAVGTYPSEDFNLVVEAHGKYPKNVVKMTPTESELLKYFSNTLNTMKIVFANEFYELAQTLGVDYNKIKSAFIKRGTEVDMYLDCNENLRAASGPCLRKDIKAIAAFTKQLRPDLELFAALDKENEKFKMTVLPGMRNE